MRLVSHREVYEHARTWIDVPVRHYGRTRKGGVDCLGLVMAVGIETGAADDPGEAFAPFADYGRVPNPKRLVAGLDQFMVAIPADYARPGDVVALSWRSRDLPMHLAILSQHQGRATFIHAFPLIKPQRVVEMGYAAGWPDRACGHWRYPRVL